MRPDEWLKRYEPLIRIWCDPRNMDLTDAEKLSIYGIESGHPDYKEFMDRVKQRGFKQAVKQRLEIGNKAFEAFEKNLSSSNPSPELIKAGLYFAYNINITPPSKSQVESTVKQVSWNISNVKAIEALTDDELERLTSPDNFGLLEAPDEM